MVRWASIVSGAALVQHNGLDSDSAGGMPRVSVIVATHNNEETIERCLGSIAAQTYSPLEIVVVDNFSTDATCRLAQRFAIRFVRAGDERCAQFNIGVAVSTGEYVLRVDADFVLEPTVVSECVAECANGADAIAVHNSPDAEVGWIARIRKFEVDMYRGDLLHSSARFLRRDAYLAVGGLDEALIAGEDYDLQSRLDRSGYVTRFIEAEALHLGEPRSLVAHLGKYFRYGGQFVAYWRKSPSDARRKLGLTRRPYFSHWRSFVERPGMGAAFVLYTLLKFSAGGLGFAHGLACSWLRRG